MSSWDLNCGSSLALGKAFGYLYSTYFGSCSRNEWQQEKPVLAGMPPSNNPKAPPGAQHSQGSHHSVATWPRRFVGKRCKNLLGIGFCGIIWRSGPGNCPFCEDVLSRPMRTASFDPTGLESLELASRLFTYRAT